MFIHKVDGLSDDERTEKLKDINFKISDELNEANINIIPKTQLTSVYDYSIFEALSIVGQKLIPEVCKLKRENYYYIVAFPARTLVDKDCENINQIIHVFFILRLTTQYFNEHLSTISL